MLIVQYYSTAIVYQITDFVPSQKQYLVGRILERCGATLVNSLNTNDNKINFNYFCLLI